MLEDVPVLIRLEREVEMEFRPQMRDRLKERIEDEQKRLGAPHCEKCGARMPSRGRKSFGVLTRFGDVDLGARVYRCKGCKGDVRPLLAHLGVEAAGCVSGGLARLVALLGVVVPYELAAKLVEQFFGITLSPMSVWRCVQRLGEACDEHTRKLAEFHADPNRCGELPSAAPDVVVAGIDGSMLGMQVRATRRRRVADQPLPPLPAVEDGHFREVKTGVLLLPAERVETSPGRRSVVRRALVTCLGHADQVFDLLWSKLHQLGWLGAHTVVVVVGDGAEWIWKRAQMFPNRCEILDFWHAIEKAWELARLRFGESAGEAKTFTHELAVQLRAGGVHTVIAQLTALVPRSPEEREKLVELIRYYTDNAARMRYDEYLRLGYGIGSGAVESAHKQVVHARLRQAGMRWSEAGARRLLALRVLLLNGEWGHLDRLAMKRFA